MKIVFVEPLGVSENILQSTKNFFEKMGHQFSYFLDRNEDETEIINRVKFADIITVSNIPITKKIISECENLKFINVAFTGIDHVDIKECIKRNIFIKNAAGYATTAVAELVLGLTLNLLKKISYLDKKTRELKTRENFLGEELFGKTVGIFGLGTIGTATAKLFSAFGCEILAYNRTPKIMENVKFVSQKYLFENSDIISLHIPANQETKNIINAELLSKMKLNAILINTARGQIIDYQYLSELLKNHKIAGAAIDVYETEPPIMENHPLLSAPNTILVPHIGYASKQAMVKRLEIVNNNIIDYLENLK
ncbi:MAG: hydroxyacid dehydrogenase [Bacteroidales bacterium]|jgi:D-3-phosphoglycerate dehydrogenase|nr:hydroxyacid dehydrogenase [Bacteroidales bacterium]